MKEKPLILVTNDDGIFAPGIAALVEVAMQFGEVVVVAPNSPQSAKGHAITIHDPLRINQVHIWKNVQSWECSGTPVDCVKLAKRTILKGRPIDLCVSGINHGSNESINIIYSGTMSAAMEGSIEGILSVGFSLSDYSLKADFTAAKHYAHKIIAFMLHHEFKLQKTRLLNVNIPKLPLEQIKGMRLCRQAEARWIEDFREHKDPSGRVYYWLTGKFVNLDNGEDTDVKALTEGYVSIVPSMHDLTHYTALDEMRHFDIENQ